MRVAVVGYGRFGPHHARVFSEILGPENVDVVDRDWDRCAAAQEAFPRASVHQSLSLSHAGAVVVATPAATHEDVAWEALREGRHVLCEKPLALSWSHGQYMLEHAAKNSQVLMTGLTYLYHPVLGAFERIAMSGQTGVVTDVHLRRQILGPVRTDVNVIHDLMTHLVPVALMMAGAPAQMASAHASKTWGGRMFDTASADLWHANGVQSHLFASWVVPERAQEWWVVGSEGSASWLDPEPRVEFRRHSLLDGVLAVQEPEPVEFEPTEPLYQQARAFLSRIEDGTWVDDALDPAVLKTVDAIQRAALGGRRSAVQS